MFGLLCLLCFLCLGLLPWLASLPWPVLMSGLLCLLCLLCLGLLSCLASSASSASLVRARPREYPFALCTNATGFVSGLLHSQTPIAVAGSTLLTTARAPGLTTLTGQTTLTTAGSQPLPHTAIPACAPFILATMIASIARKVSADKTLTVSAECDLQAGSTSRSPSSSTGSASPRPSSPSGPTAC